MLEDDDLSSLSKDIVNEVREYYYLAKIIEKALLITLDIFQHPSGGELKICSGRARSQR